MWADVSAHILAIVYKSIVYNTYRYEFMIFQMQCQQFGVVYIYIINSIFKLLLANSSVNSMGWVMESHTGAISHLRMTLLEGSGPQGVGVCALDRQFT